MFNNLKFILVAVVILAIVGLFGYQQHRLNSALSEMENAKTSLGIAKTNEEKAISSAAESASTVERLLADRAELEQLLARQEASKKQAVATVTRIQTKIVTVAKSDPASSTVIPPTLQETVRQVQAERDKREQQ